MVNKRGYCTCGNKAAWNYHYAKCMQCKKAIPADETISKWKEGVYY